MEGPIEVEIATPERRLAHERTDSVTVPAKRGYIEVLPGHAPLAGLLGAGVLSYSVGGRPKAFAVAGGFLEVAANRVRVLADSAEPAAEVDISSARAELEKALQAQAGSTSPEETDNATAAAEQAAARIEAAEEK